MSATAQALDSQPAVAESTQRIRALIVDDDLTNRLVLKLMLEKHGYEVVMAINGVDAVAKYEQSHPDIVLMDLMMPEMDGYEATRRIKAQQDRGFVPVIFLTATADEKALANCVAAGGDDFLSKPYSHALLRAKIDAQLRIRALHMSLHEQNKLLEYHEEIHKEEVRMAERIVHRISRLDHLDLPNVRYMLLPMAVLNGDLILAAPRPGGGQLFLVGDITGHGLSAAIGGMTVFDIFYTMATKGFSIEHIVPELNRKLRLVLPVGKFLAAALIELDATREFVRVWNAGMPDIYIIGNDPGHPNTFPSQHLPLGVIDNAELDLSVMAVEVTPGSRIVALSDGVLEAQNSVGELFGVERLRNCFADIGNSALLFDEVVRRIDAFRGDALQVDDITLLEITCEQKSLVDDDLADQGKTCRKPPMSWRMTLELQHDALHHGDPLPMVLQLIMDLQGLEEHREKLYLVLVELYSNALEHGVLGLDSALKRSPDGFAEYYRQRGEKLSSLREGKITIDCSNQVSAERSQLSMCLMNTGPGFDVEKIASGLDRNTALSGRGLALIRSLCDELNFSDEGRRVEAKYGWEYKKTV